MIADFEILAEGLLSGDLDPREEKRFKDHLAGCADCRRRLDEHRAMEGQLGVLAVEPVVPLSPSFDAKVMAALPKTPPWPAPPPAAAGAGKLLALAGVATALVAGGAILATGRRPSPTPSPVASPAFRLEVAGAVTAPPAGTTVDAEVPARLSGPDGLQLDLTAGTKLTPLAPGPGGTAVRLEAGSIKLRGPAAIRVEVPRAGQDGTIELAGSPGTQATVAVQTDRVTVAVTAGAIEARSGGDPRRIDSASGTVEIPRRLVEEKRPRDRIGGLGEDKTTGAEAGRK